MGGRLPGTGLRCGSGWRLVVNEAEAEQVRAIFAVFEETGSAVRALGEIDRRGCPARGTEYHFNPNPGAIGATRRGLGSGRSAFGRSPWRVRTRRHTRERTNSSGK